MMAKVLNSCKIDGLVVLEVTVTPGGGVSSARIGLTIDGSRVAQAELLGVQTLPGVQEKIDALLTAIEEGAAERYGASEDTVISQLHTPPPGLGGI